MTYTKPVEFNRNKITSNRRLKSFGRRLFFSLGVPVVFTLIALFLSLISNEHLFLASSTNDTLKNIMTFVKAITLTFLAATALNSNLNSGRMDFSLGATGILAALLAAQFVSDVSTIEGILIFMLLTVVFGMILGFINSLIFIFLKLPPIVMSLGMCLVFEGIAKLIVGGNNSYSLTSSEITANFFLEPIVIFPILGIVILILALIFCYTRYGYNKNALVYDQKISVDTGINEVANCIACFILAGALIGLYQVIDLTSQSSLQIKTDLGSSSTVFKNFLPIFIGGIIAKYSNQIVGLTLAIFSTQILSLGMDSATGIGLTQDIQSLITGFMVFGVLVYMVDKGRFLNWVKMKKYLRKERYLNPEIKEEK